MASHSDRRSAWGFARLDHPPTGFREQAGQGHKRALHGTERAGAMEAADGAAKNAARRRGIFANLPHCSFLVLSGAFKTGSSPTGFRVQVGEIGAKQTLPK